MVGWVSAPHSSRCRSIPLTRTRRRRACSQAKRMFGISRILLKLFDSKDFSWWHLTCSVFSKWGMYAVRLRSSLLRHVRDGGFAAVMMAVAVGSGHIILLQPFPGTRPGPRLVAAV